MIFEGNGYRGENPTRGSANERVKREGRAKVFPAFFKNLVCYILLNPAASY